MMFAFRTISRSIAVGLLALLAASQAYSQRSQLILPWQSDQERDPAEVKRIMGKIEQKEPSRDLNILWVWGIDQFHDGHKWSHEYSWAMDRYCYDLLPHVPRVTITPVYYWPSEKQWEEADLIVFYLWPHHDGASGFNDGTEPGGDPRSIWDYDTIDAYQKRGGALVFIHLAVLEGSGVELAKRIGFAWGSGPDAPADERTSSGSIVTTTLTDVGKNSDIFARFPASFDLHDELYWPLTGDPSDVNILAVAEATTGDHYPQDGPPKPEEMDGKDWPVAWTKEVGKGKAFGTILGHNWFAFNDPFFRIMLFRAMAWTLDESPEPFLSLVNVHPQD